VQWQRVLMWLRVVCSGGPCECGLGWCAVAARVNVAQGGVQWRTV